MFFFVLRSTAGALLFPEMAMAAIEPTVPAWMLDTMHPKKWQIGQLLAVIVAYRLLVLTNTPIEQQELATLYNRYSFVYL
jgi:hypothetical protein